MFAFGLGREKRIERDHPVYLAHWDTQLMRHVCLHRNGYVPNMALQFIQHNHGSARNALIIFYDLINGLSMLRYGKRICLGDAFKHTYHVQTPTENSELGYLNRDKIHDTFYHT